MINQLTLGVSLKDEATFENFFAGKNVQLIKELKHTAVKEGEQLIYFYGTSGEGATHLLHAACHTARQHQLRAVYLPFSELAHFSPDILEGLEASDLICLDDLHKIAGKPQWEEAFFHLYNRVRDCGARFIVSANVTPNALNITLPDVVSRLNWGMVFQLHALTDEEKLQALIMRADRRGMALSEDVGHFILTHCPRHMTTLFSVLDTLDKVSLAAQRKLTIPFVKTVLQI